MADWIKIRTNDLAFVASIAKGLGHPTIGMSCIEVGNGSVTCRLDHGITISHAHKCQHEGVLRATWSVALAALKTAQALGRPMVAFEADLLTISADGENPFETVDDVSIPVDDLLELLPFTPAKDHRRVLRGVYVDASGDVAHATATDGKRLCRRVIAADKSGMRCWVPRELLTLLKRARDAKGAKVSALQCRTNGDGKNPSRQIHVATVKRVGCPKLRIECVVKDAGKFPDCDAVIKTGRTHGFEITDVAAFRALVARIAPIVTSQMARVFQLDAFRQRLEFRDLNGQHQVVGDVPINPLERLGHELAFDPLFLLDVLPEPAKGTTFSATIIGGASSPCLVEWEGSDPADVTLIMPIKLAELHRQREADVA